MAFGDGLNDLSMIKAARYSVAMGNAVDEVKAAAGFVTATNDEDGVALVIEKAISEGLM
jgi:hydroxymethylpyrimidine pyrophosphatase-like HAD family hydrolase